MTSPRYLRNKQYDKGIDDGLACIRTSMHGVNCLHGMALRPERKEIDGHA
jgi:hypothetical protein